MRDLFKTLLCVRVCVLDCVSVDTTLSQKARFSNHKSIGSFGSYRLNRCQMLRSFDNCF